MKTYFRETDGYTYYIKNGVLYGAPTLQSGEYEVENEIAVVDFAEKLTIEDQAEIINALTNT
jgi:hypothetical protein